jgi:hypothetical protein
MMHGVWLFAGYKSRYHHNRVIYTIYVDGSRFNYNARSQFHGCMRLGKGKYMGIMNAGRGCGISYSSTEQE